MRSAGASFTDQAVQSIREAILRGELAPGTMTTVEKLAGSIGGVSRTPVREALHRLADAGMVKIERNQGVRILPVTKKDLEEAFELRLMLEVPATYRTAQRAHEGLIEEEILGQLQEQLDEMSAAAENRDYTGFMDSDIRFHEIIHLASGNQRLARIVRNIRLTLTDRGVLTREPLPDLYILLGEHKLIRDALVTQDPHVAAKTMYEHISGIGIDILDDTNWFDRIWFDQALTSVHQPTT